MISSVLSDPDVRKALRQAWEDSQPGLRGGHEEGGFIVERTPGEFAVVRWTRGQQNRIMVPSHSGCQYQGKRIVATFHTHPNTGSDFQQEPSDTDIRAVRDDPELKGMGYEGEYVISQWTIYRINPSGHVDIVEATNELGKV
jgi:hypothetical protein